MNFKVGDTVKHRDEKIEYFITEIYGTGLYLNVIASKGDANAWPVHKYSLMRRRNILLEKCK